MKRLASLLFALAVFPLPSFAEQVTLKQPAMLKSGRTIVSLKAGAVVELISREGNEITIKYRDLTGKIPASRLEESKEPPPTAKSDAPAPKSAEPTAKANKSNKPSKPTTNENSTAENKPANPPQTGYGRAVQKAKDNAAAHDKNLVRPTDEVLKE